ncbi:plasminogen-like [Bolinopsis microptera]|uniref:plasminogen-like n=1 Tax=Bolinopsis microptera TaxID=2820187 RepID=UPI003079F7B0
MNIFNIATLTVVITFACLASSGSMNSDKGAQTREPRDGCSEDVPAVTCISDPCLTAQCHNNPDARCEVDKCGECTERFYDVTGAIILDCHGPVCVEDGDNGSSYKGDVAATVSGHVCQRWDSQSPNEHSRTPERYPNAGLDDNYCRNPDGEAGPWCYNAEGTSPRWELCDVPRCGK